MGASPEEHYRLTKEELQNVLKNAKVVGDHFHFKQAIRASMDKVRRAVQKALLEQYLVMAFKSLSECDRTSPEWSKLEEKARFDAGERAKRRENELTNHRKVLCTRPENLKSDQDRKWVEQMCDEHPLLQSGHEAMIRGYKIVPLKPPFGKTRKSRAPAMEERFAQLMTEEEASRRLDEWASSVRDEGLEAFFDRPLRLISNWRPELIRIGTTPYSNAGAESKNRYLRMVTRFPVASILRSFGLGCSGRMPIQHMTVGRLSAMTKRERLPLKDSFRSLMTSWSAITSRSPATDESRRPGGDPFRSEITAAGPSGCVGGREAGKTAVGARQRDIVS